MTIDAIHLYRYALPLTTPLSLGSSTVSERRGLLLRLTLEGGSEGWGDAAPLPGFSTESLDATVDAARRLADTLPRTAIDGGDVLDAVSDRLAALKPLPASLRFAIESAVLAAVAAARDATPAAVLGGTAPRVALNALVTTEDGDDLATRGNRIRRAGYRAVKMKVGRTSIPQDVKRTRILRDAVGDDVALRLDANRAWTVDEALAFVEDLDGLSFSYIEEPLAAPDELPAFVEQTNRPVALDETTRERGPDILAAWPVRAVVLKPTLLGGLSAARRWARVAQKHGATPVVSASYESGVGIRMLAALAAGFSGAPAGLSTYVRLADDLLVPRLNLNGPSADLSSLWKCRVGTARLTRL